MENTLRCNSTSCRKYLNDRAVVTTCSHIFCVECSVQLQLSRQQPGRHPICPACDSQLPNPDDVVVTNLNPTEDYKTSVLSGLNPQIIMECAGRALSFWAYQSTQEIIFNEFISKNLSDKYNTLNIQMDKIINDANAEITNLRDKIANLQTEQQQVGRKNEELSQALRDRTRKHLHVQELYDKLKRKSMLGHVKDAAFEATEDTIHASVAANRYVDVTADGSMRPPPPPTFSSGSGGRIRESFVATSNMGPPPMIPDRNERAAAWNSFGMPNSSQHQPMLTPSTHRQRVGSDGGLYSGVPGISDQRPGTISQTHPHAPSATPRHVLGKVSGNAGPTGFAGYGMSAGLKVSNPVGSANGARPVNRSRVAQRPPSGFTSRPTPNFATGNPNMFSNAHTTH